MHASALTEAISVNISVSQLAVLIAVAAGLMAVRLVYKYAVSLKMALTALGVGLTLLSTWAGSRIYQGLQFDAKVKDYVLAAHKTDDKVKAKKYLNNALAYLKETGADQGHAAIFAGGQTDDLQEWSDDLGKIVKDMDEADQPPELSLSEVYALDKKTPVEKAVVDWKKRLEQGQFVEVSNVVESGSTSPKTVTRLRYPQGMSIAPYNTHYFFWGLGASLVTLTGSGWTVSAITLRKKAKKKQDQPPVAQVADGKDKSCQV